MSQRRGSGRPRPLILQVTTRFVGGGLGAHLAGVLRYLPEHGFDVALVYGTPEPDEHPLTTPRQSYVISGLKRRVLPHRDAGAALRLRRLIRRLNPAIVHSHGAKAGALARIVGRAGDPRRVLVHTFHGHVLRAYFGSTQSRMFLQTERVLARRSNALVAVSQRTRDELLEMRVGRADLWTVIPGGVETGRFGRPADRSEHRKRLGIPPESVVFGAFGRLVPIKNTESFIRAAARVAASTPNVHFLVAGGGELRRELERLAQQKLDNRVTFVGWVEDVATALGAVDAVVLSSLDEGTPAIIVEAAAAGIPVIATAVGGVPEMVRSGVDGWLVEPDSDEALADAMRAAAVDRDRREEFGGRARASIAPRYSITRTVAELGALYSRLIAEMREGTS